MTLTSLHELAQAAESALRPGAAADGALIEGGALLAGAGFRVTRNPQNPHSFELQPPDGLKLCSQSLLESLLGPLSPILPNLPIGNLALDVDAASGQVSLRIRLDGVWTIPLGRSGLPISDLLATVTEGAAGVSARLSGQCSLAGLKTALELRLPGELVLTGTLPPVALPDLIAAVAGPILRLPAGVAAFGLGTSQLVVTLAGPCPTLVVHSSLSDFGPGDAVVMITSLAGRWEALAALALPGGWRFSQLSPLLAPLDGLTVAAPQLIVSSFDTAGLSIPNIGAVAFKAPVSRGLSLLGSLALRGGPWEPLGLLLGLSELPLSLSACDDIRRAVITARLPGQYELVPGLLTLENFALRIHCEPLALEPSGEARLVLFGSPLPPLRASGEIGLGGGAAQLTLVTTEPWRDPAGIRGLAINQVGVSLQAPPPEYGVLGNVTLAGKTVALEVHFTANAPTFLKGAVPDRLALGDVVYDLVGLTLPALADPSLENFTILIAPAPTDTIAGEHVDAGLALQGTFEIAGLAMFVKLRIDPASGVCAQGALNKKIELGHVLVVSDAAGDGPPSMTLDTSRLPLLRLTGRIDLLGLSRAIDVAVDAAGFAVELDQDLAAAHYTLAARYRSPTAFSAEGQFRYTIDLVTRPVHLSPAAPSLGSLRVNASFAGSLCLAIENQAFRCAVAGGFHWNGLDLRIPAINLGVAPSSLADIPALVNDVIRNNAAAIFAAALQDADHWLQALAAGLVEGVDNTGEVLRQIYHRPAEQIADALRILPAAHPAVNKRA